MLHSVKFEVLVEFYLENFDYQEILDNNQIFNYECEFKFRTGWYRDYNIRKVITM